MNDVLIIILLSILGGFFPIIIKQKTKKLDFLSNTKILYSTLILYILIFTYNSLNIGTYDTLGRNISYTIAAINGIFFYTLPSVVYSYFKHKKKEIVFKNFKSSFSFLLIVYLILEIKNVVI